MFSLQLKENCHLVVFRIEPGSRQILALFPFEEELEEDNQCLVITTTGEEFLKDRDLILEQTEEVSPEQIGQEIIDAIEKKKGWELMVLDSSEDFAFDDFAF